MTKRAKILRQAVAHAPKDMARFGLTAATVNDAKWLGGGANGDAFLLPGKDLVLKVTIDAGESALAHRLLGKTRRGLPRVVYAAAHRSDDEDYYLIVMEVAKKLRQAKDLKSMARFEHMLGGAMETDERNPFVQDMASAVRFIMKDEDISPTDALYVAYESMDVHGENLGVIQRDGREMLAIIDLGQVGDKAPRDLAIAKNPPDGRLRYIAKQYAKYPLVVVAMIDVIAQTVGEDGWWRDHVEPAMAELSEDAAEKWNQRHQQTAKEEPLPDETAAYNATLHLMRYLQNDTANFLGSERDAQIAMIPLVEGAAELPGFKRANAADGAFVWMAGQLVDAYKHVERWRKALSGGENVLDESTTDSHIADNRFELERSVRLFSDRYRWLRRSGAVIGQWLKEERPDLAKMNFREVESAIRDFVPSTEPVPQGEVVAKLSDDWTVQKLTTKDQLDAEGKVMQHCVGSYYAEVSRGGTTIYSLRDKKGAPHVTIEVRGDRIVQIRGKQNADPAPKYKKYVEEFKKLSFVPRVPPRIQAILDVLLAHPSAHDMEEEYEVDYARRWHDEGFDAEDVKEWLDAGLWYSHAEHASTLSGEDVTPGEFVEFPWVVAHAIDEHSHSRDVGYLVKIARLAVQLSTCPPPASGHQLAFPFVDKAQSSEYAFDEWKKKSRFFKWSDFDDSDKSKDLFVYPASLWAAVSSIEAKPDEPYQDVCAWVTAGFTPKTAEAWYGGFLAPKTARALEARGYTPADLEDVEFNSDMDIADALAAVEAAGKLKSNRRR